MLNILSGPDYIPFFIPVAGAIGLVYWLLASLPDQISGPLVTLLIRAASHMFFNRCVDRDQEAASWRRQEDGLVNSRQWGLVLMAAVLAVAWWMVANQLWHIDASPLVQKLHGILRPHRGPLEVLFHVLFIGRHGLDDRQEKCEGHCEGEKVKVVID